RLVRVRAGLDVGERLGSVGGAQRDRQRLVARVLGAHGDEGLAGQAPGAGDDGDDLVLVGVEPHVGQDDGSTGPVHGGGLAGRGGDGVERVAVGGVGVAGRVRVGPVTRAAAAAVGPDEAGAAGALPALGAVDGAH